jgi:hypothetical protein
MSLALTPLFSRLAGSERILVAGAGGGFDVVSGLPVYLALKAMGKTVFLANLTFTYVGATDARPICPALHVVDASTTSTETYFPERHLAGWLAERRLDDTVFLFDKTGLGPMREAYRVLQERLALDAVVLVDGGTDILMHGDEAGLGTPAEDVTSLLSVADLDIPTKIIVCVGFGVDAFHGVCHAHFLENVASLAADGAFLGTFSLLPDAPEVKAWLDAVSYVQRRTPGRESIVCASIADAVRGAFGDHHSLERTRSSGAELFVNPLMSLVWSFELDAVAARCRYRDMLGQTATIWDVNAAIEGFRKGTRTRPRRLIPV